MKTLQNFIGILVIISICIMPQIENTWYLLPGCVLAIVYFVWMVKSL